MFDETLRDGQGQLLEKKGIIQGIKVDKGTVDMANFPGEKISEGIDGLRERLKEYVGLGAKFTKWRAVLKINDTWPSRTVVEANAELLARYAALAQEAGLVPLVEPEVILGTGYTLERCREVTEGVWARVFERLAAHKVQFEGMLLKASMVVIPGARAENVARETVMALKKSLPVNLAGVVFLSGGQDDIPAAQNLNEINKIGGTPWNMSFSYSRGLQNGPMKIWAGKAENVEEARQVFLHRAKMNSLATKGEYQNE